MATPGIDLGQGITEQTPQPPTQGSGMPQGPSGGQPDHHSAVGQIFHGVYSALGGGRPVMTGHATPEGTPETRPGNPGDWARGIIAGALTGLAAGSGPAARAGSPASGLGQGAVAQQEQVQQQSQQLRGQAQQEFQNKQETDRAEQAKLLNQAQIAHMNQLTAASAWDMKEKGIALSEHQVNNFNEQQKLIASDPNNKDLGTFASFDDFLRELPNHPDLAAMQAKGLIHATAGPDGVHIAEINPAWADQKNAEPVTLQIPSGVGKDGNPVYKAQTIPAGGMSNSQILAAQQALSQRELQISQEKYKQEQETKRAQGQQATTLAAAHIAAEGKKDVASIGAGRKDIAAHDKAYVQPADAVEKSYQMMDSAYREYQAARAQGKQLPTGAQSMLALSQHLSTTFGNVKGSRITKDMIQEHLHARSVSDSARVALQRLTNGDQLSPDQWEAFHALIGESRRLSWETAVKEAKRKNIPVDFLPPDLNSMAAPANAESEVFAQDGKTLIGHVVDGKYVPLTK